jgi:hypothetical protein
MKAKAVLFLILGLLCATVRIIDHPTLKEVLLLALTVWCGCRLYYFAFYVIEHYIDPGFRFSGLMSAVHYLLSKKPVCSSAASNSK